jgi:hypothetical protein
VTTSAKHLIEAEVARAFVILHGYMTTSPLLAGTAPTLLIPAHKVASLVSRPGGSKWTVRRFHVNADLEHLTDAELHELADQVSREFATRAIAQAATGNEPGRRSDDDDL